MLLPGDPMLVLVLVWQPHVTSRDTVPYGHAPPPNKLADDTGTSIVTASVAVEAVAVQALQQ